ncbi:MAG TPA: hypothetical protein VHI93_07830 [Candidatus Thermoplasmatota archaeon]|nr:hypothetical protein [Candidatus Thermoplasmatota archaeon]
MNAALAASLALLLPAPASAETGPYLPPQNLHWNQTSETTVELTWDAPLDADAATTYNVYRGDELLASTPTTTYTGTFSGIALFRVVAVHPSGESGTRASWQSTINAFQADWGVESVPAWAVVGTVICPPIGVSTYTGSPWVAYTVHSDCIPHP